MATIIFSRIPDTFDIVSEPSEVKVKGLGQFKDQIMHKHNKIRC